MFGLLAISLVGIGVGLSVLASRNPVSASEVESLRARLANDTRIPYRARQWIGEVLGAVNQTLPSGVSPEEWARAIFAVIERESGGGEFLNPPGPAGVADGGYGRGLMSIDIRSHEFANTGDWQDPAANILYGAGVLQDCFKAFSGKAYGYPTMFLALAAYNAGIGRIRGALALGNDPDSVTTKHYASTVYTNATGFSPYGAVA